MLQIGRDLNFLEEPLRPDDRGHTGSEQLDRHLAAMLDVNRRVDSRHAALAEEAVFPSRCAFNLIAGGEPLDPAFHSLRQAVPLYQTAAWFAACQSPWRRVASIAAAVAHQPPREIGS